MLTVNTISLKEFIDLPYMREMVDAFSNLAPACLDCHWSNVCRGGRLVNRHSKAEGFNNPSVICDDLREFYAHIAAYLLNSGLPFAKLHEVLHHGKSPENLDVVGV